MAAKLNQSADKLNSGESRGLKALKVLVVVMGVLIVAGVITIVVTIVSRLSEKSKQGQQVVTVPPAVFGSLPIALPDGARVISVAADAGRLFVHIELGKGRSSVLVLDGASGARLGVLDFKPAD